MFLYYKTCIYDINDKNLIETHGKFLTLENIDSIDSLNIYTGEDNIGRKWIFTDKQIKNLELMHILKCYNV